MNYLDYIFLGIMAWYLYRGLKRGIILQVFSLIGIITALIIAAFFSDFMAEIIKRKVPELEFGINWITTFIIFLLVLIGFYMAGAAFTKFINLIFLKKINQFLGAVLGLIKAITIILFFVYFTSELKYNNKPLISISDREISSFYTKTLEISEKYVPKFFPKGRAERYRKRFS